MQVQLGHNKYQLQVIELNETIIDLRQKLAINSDENLLFKNNISNLQIELSNKNTIIDNLNINLNLLIENKDAKIDKLNQSVESSQIIHRQSIGRLIYTIDNLDKLQDEFIIIQNLNKENDLKYNEVKLKYQNTLIKLEDTINLNNTISECNIIVSKELNLYKELNLTKTNENDTLKLHILDYINQINIINRTLFEKDNYLKSLQKKYVNEKPIIAIQNQENNQIKDNKDNNDNIDLIEKISFKRGLKMSRKN